MIKSKKVLALSLICLFIGSLAGCIRKHESTKQEQLFDLNWKFHWGDVSSVDATDFNDPYWKEVDLPHDWSIDENISINNSTKCTGWYVKTFDIPCAWKNKQISIHFDGIGDNAKVVINGTPVRIEIQNNYTATCDLSKHLNYNGQNKLSVCVSRTDEANRNRDSSSGIYKHVWLIITDSNLFSAK